MIVSDHHRSEAEGVQADALDEQAVDAGGCADPSEAEQHEGERRNETTTHASLPQRSRSQPSERPCVGKNLAWPRALRKATISAREKCKCLVGVFRNARREEKA